MIPGPGSQVGNLFIIYLIFFFEKRKFPEKKEMTPRPGSQVGNLCVAGSISAATLLNPKVFFDFQFPPNMQNVVQNIWKTFLATLLNPQSIFLTFSFYHNLQNILQTSEGNQSSWIAIIY